MAQCTTKDGSHAKHNIAYLWIIFESMGNLQPKYSIFAYGLII